MTLTRSRIVPLSVYVTAVLLAPHGFAQSGATGGAARPTASSSAQKSSTTGRTARGPLPDPTLLDGSTQEPEKKSEKGMLGEFEIPGDEDARSGKVGGPQRPPGAGKGANDPGGVQISIPGMPPLGLPSGAGAGGAPGGLPSLNLPDPTKSGTSAGAGSGAPQTGAPPAGSGNASGPQMPGNDAGAGGIQVAELKTDGASPGGGAGGADGGVQKPKPVTIGDPARIITPAANAPGVIGAQTTAGNTQQADKATGGGGKGSSNDNGNRGVEKGRTMPSGL